MTRTTIRVRRDDVLRTAIENVPRRDEFPLIVGESVNAIVVTDPINRIIHINSGFSHMFGYSPADILGRPLDIVFGGRDELALKGLRGASAAGEAYKSEIIAFGKMGQRLWASFTANPVYGPDGHIVTVCVFTDITETKLREVLHSRAVDALARDASSAEVLELVCRDVESIISETVVAINGVDENGHLYPVAAPGLPDNCRRAIRGALRLNPESPSLKAVLTGEGVVVEDIAADPVLRDSLGMFLDFGIQACWATPIIAADGRRMGTVTYYFFEKRAPDDFERRLSRVLINLCSLSLERHRIRQDMLQLSFYDSLTRLPNRNLLLANGDKMISELHGRNEDMPVAVLCLNLDRFRQVNATLGYDAGDKLLAVVAERLRENRYPGDIVGRVGADEFVLMLPGCDEGKASLLASRLLATVSEPCVIEGEEIAPLASIGIALYPENGFCTEALLDSANTALAQAKAAGDGIYKFFSEDANVRARRDLSLESRLRAAVGKNELRLFYQPQVSFDSGVLHGVEALARWNNPEFGPVSPESFIPMAEKSGQINGICEWAVGEVCRQLADWRRHGVAVPSVSVNMSAPNFRERGLPEMLVDSIARNGLSVTDITLELTESVFLDNDPDTIEVLRRVVDLGFRLSLDDFGTGYSGLGYLKNIPVSEIKLDRSFVRDLVSNPASRNLSLAIMRLGENLGLRVVVEGVETGEQFLLLKNQGFHVLQGYYISHPLSPEALEKWLEGYGGDQGR